MAKSSLQETDSKKNFNILSGQHLLSAILENEYNLPTTSWWLGADESFVELDSVKVADDVVQRVEDRCNDLIRQALPVTVKFCKADDPDLNEVCVPTVLVILLLLFEIKCMYNHF